MSPMSQTKTKTHSEPEPDVPDVGDVYQQPQKEDIHADADDGLGTDDGLLNRTFNLSDIDSGSGSDSRSDDHDLPSAPPTQTPTPTPPLHRILNNAGMPTPMRVNSLEDMLSWGTMFFEQLNKARSGPGIDIDSF